jgi:hypothetical protein
LVLATVTVAVLCYVMNRATMSGRKPEPVILEFTGKGMTFLSGTGREEVDWTAFGRHIEINDLFLLEMTEARQWIMLPKRAFSGAGELERFRVWLLLRSTAPALTETPAQWGSTGLSRPRSTSRVIQGEFCYRFPDYLDRVLASWFTRAIMLLIMGTAVYSYIEIHREGGFDPSYSILTRIAVTAVPTSVLMLFTPLVFAAKEWFADTHRHDLQNLQITEQGMIARSFAGTAERTWSIFSRYKETRRSFLIWGKVAGKAQSDYVLIPKRALGRAEDVEWFRSLLSARLQASSWYVW